MRLVEVKPRRVAIETPEGFPWRGLAVGLLCWLAIGLLLAAL